CRLTMAVDPASRGPRRLLASRQLAWRPLSSRLGSCRDAARQRVFRKTCARVAFCEVSAASTDSGKVYALGKPRLPWQTPKRSGPSSGWSNVMDACRGAEVSERNTLQGVKVLVIDDSNTIRRSADIFL